MQIFLYRRFYQTRNKVTTRKEEKKGKNEIIYGFLHGGEWIKSGLYGGRNDLLDPSSQFGVRERNR